MIEKNENELKIEKVSNVSTKQKRKKKLPSLFSFQRNKFYFSEISRVLSFL